jgi:signal transduction histidine kinase
MLTVMQGEKAQDPIEDVAHLLRQIADEPDTMAAVEAAMLSLQRATEAAAITLIQPSYKMIQNHIGVRAFDEADVDSVRAWAERVGEDWQRHVQGEGFVTGCTCWYSCGLGDGIVLLLWFDTDIDLLPGMYHDWSSQFALLKIACQSLTSSLRQKRNGALTRSLMDSILDPLLVLNEDMTVSMMNEAAENLFGVTTEAVRYQPLTHVVQAEDLIAMIMDPPESDRGRPVEWSTGDESNLTFLPRLSVVHTPAGESDGWILAMRDVSRFKRFNENQREFVRIVSHDLRSPLTSMQGFADMIRMGMVGDVTEKQAYFLDKILSGVTQMTSIVENIQDAGRFDPETGFYDMERAHLDLRQMVPRIVEDHILPPEKPGLSIYTKISEEVPILNADENMLSRALANLVDNAIKYTPDGGTIEVAVHKDGEHVVLSVTDDGHGISEEDQRLLFQRHVRLDRKRHRKVKGTGLGLFIVRSVAFGP